MKSLKLPFCQLQCSTGHERVEITTLGSVGGWRSELSDEKRASALSEAWSAKTCEKLG